MMPESGTKQSPPEPLPQDKPLQNAPLSNASTLNDLIRDHAGRLWRKYFFKLILICALLNVMWIAWVPIDTLFTFKAPTMTVVYDQEAGDEELGVPIPNDPMKQAVETFITFAGNVLTWPLANAGMALLMLWVWAGNAPRVQHLFAFARPRNGLFRAWALGLIVQLAALTWIPALFIIAQALIRGTLGAPTPATIDIFEYYRMQKANGEIIMMHNYIKLPCQILATWLGYRLTLVPYLLARNPESGVKHTIAESWRLMKGKCWRAFCLQLSTCVIPGLLAIVFVVASAAGAAFAGGWIPLAILVLCAWIFLPYMYLAMAGLAAEILDGALPADDGAAYQEATSESAASPAEPPPQP